MTLPVGRDARKHRDRAVVVDLHRAVVVAGAVAGDLDVVGDADAELIAIALQAPFGLLPAQFVVSGQLDGAFHGAEVVPGVIDGPCRGRNGGAVGLEQVPPPDLHCVHSQFGRQQVHGPLHERARLRTPGAPQCSGGGRVGHDAARPEVDARDPVGARRHHLRVEGEPGADVGVGTGVLRDVHLHAHDGAVGPRADLHVLHLAAGVAHVEHVLGARLDPPQRVAETHRQSGGHDLFRVGVALGSESAAGCGHHDVDLLDVEFQAGGDRPLDRERALRGHPEPQAPPAVRGVDIGDRQDPVGLHGRRRDLLVHVPERHDDVGAVERSRVLDRVDLEHDLRAVQRIGDGGQFLDLDGDLLGPVASLRQGVGHDGCDGIAHVAHRPASQSRASEVRGCRWAGEHVGEIQVVRRIDAFAPGDTHDPPVWHVRAHEDDVARLDVEVVHVGPAADQQRRVLAAQHAMAEDRTCPAHGS